MTTPVAGWYPDPAGSGGVRWWSGAAWGEQVQPAPQPSAQAAPQPWDGGAAGSPQWTGNHAAPQPWGGQPGDAGQPWGASAPQWPVADQPPAGFAKRNQRSIAAVVVSLLLVVLMAAAHLVVLGVLPVFLAVAAVREKEPLSWPAAGITAAVLLFAALNFF